ncbi:MAG: hypothetical protein ACLFRT_00165 [Actinomycetota bacterium]
MRMFLAVGLLLAGCAAQPSLEGVDLPPASIPDDLDPAQWAVAFSHDFGPGFWDEGPHAYQLFLDCPDAEEAQVESEVVLFAANPDSPTFDAPVHLRVGGLSTTPLGSSDVRFVNPEQKTIALVTVVGLSREEVDAVSRCTGEVFWDEGSSAPLRPGEPFRP